MASLLSALMRLATITFLIPQSCRISLYYSSCQRIALLRIRNSAVTLGRLIPGNMMLEQYANAIRFSSEHIIKVIIDHTVDTHEIGRVEERFFKGAFATVLQRFGNSPWKSLYEFVGHFYY